ncbi:MAG: phospholipase [Bacteroidales bacterium]|nr:phospholipase [Bacteroidales bacterium]
MKLKNITNTLQKLLLGSCVALAAGFVTSCNDDDKVADVNVAFDPNQPVVVTDFMPKSAGQQEQILVYGSNFGNDRERVKLYVGGKEALIVNVLNDKLYAYVPVGAFGSTVEVAILDEDGEEIRRGVSSDALSFEYVRKTVVGTLCGYRNVEDSQGELYGDFAITCGFRNEGCLTFDPLYPNRLYLVYDYGNKIDLLDLEARQHLLLMSSSKFQNNRLRNCAFTLDGQYMLVSTDRNDNNDHSTSVWIVKRNSDGTFNDNSSTSILAAYRQCNGVAVHPINGEVYFNSYKNGQLFRLDIDKYFACLNGELLDDAGEPVTTWNPYEDTEGGYYTELFKIMDPSYEFNITIHPTGNYAYLNVINRSYILRCDYDWKTKRFTNPYLVAGKNGNGGWEDAVGGDSRVNKPYQGIFVKNPEYAGRSDEYDYYFCDWNNYCVRYITPEGLVRTYAGHSPSTDNNVWGTEDGDLRTQARFRDVSGIAYDEDKEMFYVQDHNNRRIRTIGKEDEHSIDQNPTPDTPDAGEENEDNAE